MYNCFFQICRGNTGRFVFIFYLVDNSYYIVEKKRRLGRLPYELVGKFKIPINLIRNFINTVVANT